MAKINTSKVCAILLLYVVGCVDSNLLYHHSFELPAHGWAQTSILEDVWISEKTTSQPALVLKIIFAPDFSYQNLYLTTHLEQNATVVLSDTFSIQLAHPHGGGWLGQKTGDFIAVTDTLSIGTPLSAGSELKYKIGQFSRDEMLRGIRTLELTMIGE